jgi:hypothetical protein
LDKGSEHIPTKELAEGAGMAGSQVYAYYELAHGTSEGEAIRTGVDVSVDLGMSAVWAGSLYKARWAARATPVADAIAVAADAVEAVGDGGIGSLRSALHNEEYETRYNRSLFQERQMVLDYGRLVDVYEMMVQHDCLQ